MATTTTPTRLDSPPIEDLLQAFPQYEIEAELGRGGMGAVYRARHRKFDRRVAIKVLLPQHDGPEFVERFEREARALAKLDHPNIVSVHESGESGGLCYLVMDFVDGANLRQLLDAGDLTVNDALAIVPQICDALQHAHDRGVLHRDIKPENVLIDQDGTVRIADFGLARLVTREPGDVTLTHSRQGLGTPHYMAPEQVAMAGTVDQRADVYSLGVMLYELLTGELPIGRFDLPSRRSKELRGFDNVVLRSLASNPGRRYGSVAAIKQELLGNRSSSTGTAARYRKKLADQNALDPGRFRANWYYHPSWEKCLLALVFMLSLRFRFASESGRYRGIDLLDISFLGLSPVLLVVVGLSLAIIHILRANDNRVPRFVSIGLAAFGTVYCVGFASEVIANPRQSLEFGAVSTTLCMIGWLAVELRDFARKPPQRGRRRRARQ